MKIEDLRKFTAKELTTKLDQERALLDKLKLTHKLNPIENPMRIRASRKLIARIKTTQSMEKQTSQPTQ